MWVFIILLVIGSTIIVTRVFRNGAREEAIEPAERRTFTPASSPSAPKTRQPAPAAPAISPTTVAASSQAARSQPQSHYPSAAAERAGGACPSCGTETVPGAKFCGECGHRLVS